jgi:SAM-dependent methyltransferase
VICPLCNGNSLSIVENAFKESYLCNDCNLIFVNPELRLDEVEEKSRYSFHQNRISDQGYVDFLNQVISPTLKFIDGSMIGLDYGCGPNPVLSELIKQHNIECDFYDPYFFPKIDLQKRYDFIFATECFEHFFSPQKEMETIFKLLKPNGILAIMTEFWTSTEDFSHWYYPKDPTHVSFYNLESFDFICKHYGLQTIFCDEKRVVLMRKNG